MSTDHNEAMRLAEWHTEQAHGWRNAASHSAADKVEPVRSSLLAKAAFHDQAAALLRQQAERIAELEGELADLHTTMFAAAVEIQEHWEAHCDAEGYGPANLMHRLERGTASQYGYDAKTLQRIKAERDQIRAEVERMRADAERLDWLESEADDLRTVTTDEDDYDWIVISHHMAKPHEREVGRAKTARAALDAARTTHKETE